MHGFSWSLYLVRCPVRGVEGILVQRFRFANKMPCANKMAMYANFRPK